MGEVLSKPVTEKSTNHGANNHVIYGQSSMQGYRINMEDAHSTILELPKEEGGPSVSYFAVFDGHNGSNLAKRCSKELQEILIKNPSFKKKDYEKALKDAFVELDERFIKDNVEDGAAAIVALITEDRRLIIANAGDCRAVVSNGGVAVDLSEDHKPNLPSEMSRIQKAGGIINYSSGEPRLNGIFSLSRSFGDIEHKSLDLPPQERAMSCYPDITIRQLSEDDEFLILACDGIWNVCTSQEAVGYVRTRLSNNENTEKNLDRISSSILDYCLTEEKSLDNMTMIIVGFLFDKSAEAWHEKFNLLKLEQPNPPLKPDRHLLNHNVITLNFNQETPN